MLKEFFKECWEWAYGHSYTWAKWLGYIGGPVSALAFAVSPTWGKQHLSDQVNYWLKAIPVLGFVVFSFRLLVSPYYVWRSIKDALEASKEEGDAKIAEERKASAILLEAEKNATAQAIAESLRLKSLLDAKPLNPIQKRNKFDEFIESANAIYVRLLGENGEAALPDAVKWMEDLQAFATVHLTFQDYRALHDVGPEFSLVVSTAMQMAQGNAKHMREVTATLASRLLKIKRLRNQVTDWKPAVN